MSEPTVRFPVACPKCGTERLTEFPVDAVADALKRGSDICLVATCHELIWTATELELEQIHEYRLEPDAAVRIESADSPRPASKARRPEAGRS